MMDRDLSPKCGVNSVVSEKRMSTEVGRRRTTDFRVTTVAQLLFSKNVQALSITFIENCNKYILILLILIL